MSNTQSRGFAVLIRRLWRPALGLIGLVALMAWSGGACTPKVKPGTVPHAAGLPVPQTAARYTVAVEDVPVRIAVVGTTLSEQHVNVSSRLSAYVRDVAVTAGSVVTNGQVLVTLDDREIREQLAAAEAQVKQAESEYQRAQQLFAKSATTEQALEGAEAAAHAARAQVDRAKVMLTYARLTAPMDSVVIERRVEPGDLANPGQVLLSVYDPAHMRLEAPVPVRLVERLRLGQEVAVELERPAGSITGRVTEIVSEVDPGTRTQKVKVQLGDAAGRVLPGTFGRLWVEDAPRSILCVPAQAVYRVGQLELVQVVRNGRALRRLVKTGPEQDGRVEILSGLQAGDVVLATPLQED